MARQGRRTVELHDLRVTVDLLSAARAFHIGRTAVHSIDDCWGQRDRVVTMAAVQRDNVEALQLGAPGRGSELAILGPAASPAGTYEAPVRWSAR